MCYLKCNTAIYCARCLVVGAVAQWPSLHFIAFITIYIEKKLKYKIKQISQQEVKEVFQRFDTNGAKSIDKVLCASGSVG